MELKLKDLTQNRQIANLISSLDKPNFWMLLVRTIKTHIVFDNWVVLRFSDTEQPVVYVENLMEDGTADLLFQDYLNGLYVFDPFFIASRNQHQSGMFLLDEVAPESFTSTDYYRLYFQKNIVADEIQFNYASDHRQTLCFSIGRGTKFSADEIAFLSVISTWVIALMQQREHFEMPSEGQPSVKSETNWRDGVEKAISKVKGPKLTSREVEIGQLMMSGYSSKNIAAKLNISIETVRAHKKHIYTKLEINSQSELFAIFYQAQKNQSASVSI